MQKWLTFAPCVIKKDKDMKKLAFYMLMLVMSIGYAYAQGGADIKFDKTTHNF